uniref:Uncharacterized protein n=1 Tax=Tanacetum cinerariifolium TaxID=118510 RepID=A0A6L2JSA6_TANCI|nr:hypothetical protein [Tanacetum cinerariifolium]
MAEMFGLLKEITTNRAHEKVLIKEEAKSPVTENVNFISLARGEGERNGDNDVATGEDIEKPTRTETGMPVKEVEKENKAEDGIKNKPIRKAKKEETTEAPRFNDSLLGSRVRKIKERTYNLSPRGPVYEAILRKNNKEEDEKRPFILGTPFPTTAKAVIKFYKGTISLRFGKSKISFHRILESLCKSEGIKNNIELIAPTMTVNMLVLEWEEKIKLHQEKEM